MDTEYAVKTYRYLRIAMIAVILMLLAAVVFEWHKTGWSCLQESISAYYFTPVQSVFVGALITIGVCMIALRGLDDVEDTLMNLCGMLAPVVALVPTPDPGGCRSMGAAVKAAPENIENNMIALFAAGLVGLAATLVTLLGDKKKAQKVGFGVAAAVFAVGAILFIADRDYFEKVAHYGAAIPLFALIIVVVFLSSRQGWRRAYKTIGWLMVLSVVIFLGLARITHWAHWVLAVESALILLFAVFWGIQTADRRNLYPAKK